MAVAKSQHQQIPLMPAPLFDRLVDENPLAQEESRPLKTYTIDETLQSISQELYYLLNTRTSIIPYSIYATREEVEETDISNRYGLPDFSKFGIPDSTAGKKLARQICRAVEHYESRLSNVSVRLVGLDQNQHLVIEISGIVYAYPSRERFTFPVAIDRPQGE